MRLRLLGMTMAAMAWFAMLFAPTAEGQASRQKTPAAFVAPTAAPRDSAFKAVEARIGRALFLRGFYPEDNLSYDSGGRVQGMLKTGEWTLSAIDVQKAARNGPRQILLEGVRVAIRYNPDSHQFERHPQSDEKMRMTLAEPADGRGMERVLDAIFAQESTRACKARCHRTGGTTSIPRWNGRRTR